MSGPSLHIGLPPSSLFKFPPDEAPPALPPPSDDLHRIASPFQINPVLYNQLLHPAVPITIAAVYATTVTSINAYNRNHGNKPWAISKTRPFFAFVILHNVFLAVYSAVTCLAMARGLYVTFSGLNGPDGLVGAVDSLCKMHGPRGLGDAAAFNPASGNWEVTNSFVQLNGGAPQSSDLGRLWNEGLAFWGWWFYLSKFYEVLDTFIILAKGKRSTTLQTYHHAGAMLCMWAGIRYMSPPIWMFVQINSAIHAMMYTYYTLSALGVRVPQAVKRTLTTLQIFQFVIGASFAGIHLLISYTVPVSTPYRIAKTAQDAVSVVSSVASSAVAEATTVSAVYSVGSYIKRLALRAAGEEGLAENIGERPQHFVKDRIVDKVHDVTGGSSFEMRYRDEYEWVNCIDTTGQSFAVWLNMMYLAPLTALFVRFFYRSYISRTIGAARRSSAIPKSAVDAAKGVNHKVDKAGRALEPANGTYTRSLTEHNNEMDDIAVMKKNINDRFTAILKDEEQTVLRRQQAQDTCSGASENGGLKKEESQPNGTPNGAHAIGRANGHANGHANGSVNGGLSTTNPKEEGLEYAEVVKKPSP